MNSRSLAEVIRILEDVISSRLDPREALKQWSVLNYGEDKEVEKIWHQLTHYAADHDIHGSDPEYKKWQLQKLRDGVLKVKERQDPLGGNRSFQDE